MAEDTVDVTVVEGYAVFVDGEQHPGGSTVTVPVDLAEQWQGAGWVAPAKRRTTKRSS